MDVTNRQNFGYSEKIPEHIRTIMIRLCKNISAIQQKWDFYLTLFGIKQNFDLWFELGLESSRHVIEESLRYDITMAFYRLNDNDKRNLSIVNLVKKCPNIPEINTLLIQFQEACKPIIKHRHTLAGHEDSDTALKPREHPIQLIHEEQINMMLRLAAKILNTIFEHYEADTLNFHVVSRGGADELIYWLNEGKLHHPEKFSA